jgi:RNA polymerase sigma factor (sigma-70 family)
MSEKKETDIINGFIAGDDAVLDDFYRQHYPAVRGYILRNSGTVTDAQDVFQDALVLTFQKLQSDTFRLECSLATYVFAVSRNIWMNTLRKRKKLVYRDNLPAISKQTVADIANSAEQQEKIFTYQKFFLKLGKDCQRLLTLFFEGQSMAAISQRMGYSVGYTRKKKFECKKALLEMLEKDGAFNELRNS